MAEHSLYSQTWPSVIFYHQYYLYRILNTDIDNNFARGDILSLNNVWWLQLVMTSALLDRHSVSFFAYTAGHTMLFVRWLKLVSLRNVSGFLIFYDQCLRMVKVDSVLILTHSLTHSLIHLFTHSLTYPLIQTLTHSFSHSPTHSLTHSFTHLLTHPPTHSLIQSHTHSHTRSFTHSLIHHSFTHSFTHSLIHSLIHSFTHLLI